VIDGGEPLQGAADQAPVAPARAEVGAHAAAQVGRLAHVERPAAAVAHEVHPRPRRQLLGQGELERVACAAGPREGHRALQGVDAALGEQPQERHQDLRRGLGVGQGAVDRLHRRVGPAGQGAQVVPLHLAVEQPPREHERVEPGLGEVAARQPAALVIEKAQVEGRVVGHEHVLAGEVHEGGERVLDVGAGGDHLVVDAGELGDHGGDGPVRVHEGDEAVDHLARPDAHRADLGHLRQPGRAAGRLQVDDAEGGRRQAGSRPVRRRQADQVAAEPGEPGVALDDLGDEPSLEPLGTAAQPQQLGGHVPNLERPPAPHDERAQAVGQRVRALGPRLGHGEREVELCRGSHRRPTLTPTPAVTRRPRRPPARGAGTGRTGSPAAPGPAPRPGS
jgi:hypothetical protein